MRFKIFLAAILSMAIANGYLMADTTSWLSNIYKEANEKGTLMYFVRTEYDQWHDRLKTAIKFRKLKEAEEWYNAIEKTVRINFIELGNLHDALSECDRTKAFADKCWEIIQEKYKGEMVSRCFSVGVLCTAPARVNEVRKQNFTQYFLDEKVMDMYFSEDDPDESQYVADFVPQNLLIDGEMAGNSALYYDGTTHMYSPDREHSKVANLIAREYETISRLFKDGHYARRFLALLFEKYPNARLFEEQYRKVLPKLQRKVATEGKLASVDIDELIL